MLVNDNNKKGFTLIELLVVISIIAILAAVGIVIYGSVQKNGRISKRMQDLTAMKLAVEAYKVDNPSGYPSTSSKWFITPGTNCANVPALPGGGTPASSQQATANAVIPGLAPNYIAAVPSDPGDGCYAYISDGTNYKIMAFGATEMKTADYQAKVNYSDSSRVTGSPSVYDDWALFNDPSATSLW